MIKYSKNRTPSKVYRSIYIKHHGAIPLDENGRTYEIHHIDGDHTNNDIKNLIALSMQDHYDLHYAQGDYGACVLMAFKMNMTDEEISELISASHQKRISEGTHPTQQKWTCEWCNKSGINMLNYHNSHDKRCKKNPNISDEDVRKRKNTSAKQSKSASRAQLDSVRNGTHNTQEKWHCIHCNLNGKGAGNYRYHGENCLKNPNLSDEEKIFRNNKSKNNPMKNTEISKKFRDPVIYKFVNVASGEIMLSTRQEFIDKHNCKSCQISTLIKYPSKSLYGWKIIRD